MAYRYWTISMPKHTLSCAHNNRQACRPTFTFPLGSGVDTASHGCLDSFRLVIRISGFHPFKSRLRVYVRCGFFHGLGNPSGSDRQLAIPVTNIPVSAG
ncbi:hypothetical protein [Parapedobacter tibetensis]|uniref:hypothetical protein n=1 Tax=Parapedobacter tibetensis TaxID=2972951 RepID=UPI00214DD925|nr:hypothetical protein [Parapedobacter tibetensis]